MAIAKQARQTSVSSPKASAEPSKVDGSITNEELAQKVIDGVQSAKLTAEDLYELRNRFKKLKKTDHRRFTVSALRRHWHCGGLRNSGLMEWSAIGAFAGGRSDTVLPGQLSIQQ